MGDAFLSITELVRTRHGNMYISINFDLAGTPIEVFGVPRRASGCDLARLEGDLPAGLPGTLLASIPKNTSTDWTGHVLSLMG